MSLPRTLQQEDPSHPVVPGPIRDLGISLLSPSVKQGLGASPAWHPAARALLPNTRKTTTHSTLHPCPQAGPETPRSLGVTRPLLAVLCQ